VEKFDKSWSELVETVQTALDDAKQGKPDPGGSKAGDIDAGQSE
jgi:transaldolase